MNNSELIVRPDTGEKAVVVQNNQELQALMDFAEFTMLAGVPNVGTRAAYRFAIQRFFGWLRDYILTPGASFDRTAVLTYLATPTVQTLSASTRNAAIAALKRLARELYYKRLLPFETWRGVSDVKGEKPHSKKAPNWLTEKQLDELMRLPDESLHGKRDRALLAIVTGCGLRRSELCQLKVESKTQRAGRWVFVVHGKGNKTRMVPIPNGVVVCIDNWLMARANTCKDMKVANDAPLLCPVYTGDVVKDRHLNEQTVYDVVRSYGERLGLETLAPHDLRRTYAKLTRGEGADLDQIQKILGHDSISTTQVYIGDNQNLTRSPGDLLKTDWTGIKEI